MGFHAHSPGRPSTGRFLCVGWMAGRRPQEAGSAEAAPRQALSLVKDSECNERPPPASTPFYELSRAPPARDKPQQLDLEWRYVDADSRPNGDGLPNRQQRSEVEWQLPHGPLSSTVQAHGRSLPGFRDCRAFPAPGTTGCPLCPRAGAGPGAQGTCQPPTPPQILASTTPHGYLPPDGRKAIL